MGPNIKILIRLLVGVGLLAFLWVRIGVESMLTALTEFHPQYFIAAIALMLSHFFVQSLAFRALLVSRGIEVAGTRIFRITLISYFFGVFLPGGIGPDVVLCYHLSRSSAKMEDALSAIAFVRITVLFIMAILAFAVSFHPLVSRPAFHWLTGGVVAFFIAYFTFMAYWETLSWARQLLGFLNRSRITAVVYRTYYALAGFGRDPHVLSRVLPWLLVSACIKICTDYLLARALGFDIPLGYFFLFVPVISVAASLPVTFAGLGVREVSFAALFSLAGVPVEQAVAIGMLTIGLIVTLAAVGGVCYMVGGVALVGRPDPSALSGSGPPVTNDAPLPPGSSV